MLKIEFDPSTLSKAQREDLASFILGWEVPNDAPLSADAVQSRIAPVDTTVNTSAGNVPLPPVPQPGLPVGTAAPQSPNLVGVDSKGMPWDDRIHSSSRAKVAGGTWKYKRGVTDDEIKRVEIELVAMREGPSDNTDCEPETLFTAPLVPTSGSPGVAAITAPPPPATAEPDLRKEFAQLMIRVANAKGSGKITTEEVTAALAEHNVQSLPMLSTKLDRVPPVAAAIDALIASRG